MHRTTSNWISVLYYLFIYFFVNFFCLFVTQNGLHICAVFFFLFKMKRQTNNHQKKIQCSTTAAMYRDIKWLKHIHRHIDIHVFNSWFGLSFSVVDSVSAQIRGDCFYFIKYSGRFVGFLRSCTHFFFGRFFDFVARLVLFNIISYICFIPAFVVTLYGWSTARHLILELATKYYANLIRQSGFVSFCGIFCTLLDYDNIAGISQM